MVRPRSQTTRARGTSFRFASLAGDLHRPVAHLATLPLHPARISRDPRPRKVNLPQSLRPLALPCPRRLPHKQQRPHLHLLHPRSLDHPLRRGQPALRPVPRGGDRIETRKASRCGEQGTVRLDRQCSGRVREGGRGNGGGRCGCAGRAGRAVQHEWGESALAPASIWNESIPGN